MITSAPAEITFERMLIPTDFSDISRCAIEYARTIATRSNAQILLTHVNREDYPGRPLDYQKPSHPIQQEIEEQLEQEVVELRSAGVEVRTIFLRGRSKRKCSQQRTERELT